MRKINCPGCGALTTIGEYCEFCGNLVSGQPSLKADSLKPKPQKNKNSEKILIYETKELSKESLIAALKKEFEWIISGNNFYDKDIIPPEFNKDSLTFGEIKKIYLPIYQESGEYQAMWIDNNNMTGNFTGNYVKWAYLVNSDNPVVKTLALLPSDKVLIYESKIVSKSNLKLEGQIVKGDKKELVRTGFLSTLNNIAYKKAEELLKGSPLKTVDAKFTPKETMTGYISFQILPIFLNGKFIENVFSEAIYNPSLYFSIFEFDSILEKYYGYENHQQYKLDRDVQKLKNKIKEDSKKFYDVHSFLKEFNSNSGIGWTKKELKKKMNENQFNQWVNSFIQQIKSEKPLKMSKISKIITWFKT